MMNLSELKLRIDTKKRIREEETLKHKFYNEAIEYEICPSCGGDKTLIFTVVPTSTVRCFVCNLTAEWNVITGEEYINFKEANI